MQFVQNAFSPHENYEIVCHSCVHFWSHATKIYFLFWQVGPEDCILCTIFSKYCRPKIKSSDQFWINSGSILNQFWIILGQFWIILGHFWQFWSLFGQFLDPFRTLLEPFLPFWDIFWLFSDHFWLIFWPFLGHF